jgi:hypothetical protein
MSWKWKLSVLAIFIAYEETPALMPGFFSCMRQGFKPLPRSLCAGHVQQLGGESPLTI